MKIAELPNNEKARIRDLRDCEILDTEPEAAYDHLVDLAAQVCGTSASMVSLVDADRQWFKAKIGIDACETARDISFCAHAILDDGLLIVEDATKDARFFDNPLVTGELGLRFYAGVPLRNARGHNLGALCVVDPEPRSLDGSQKSALRALGEAVVAQLELRRQLIENQRQAREVAQARDKALAASRLKSEILSNITHELRTPLNSILGFSEVLLDGPDKGLSCEQEELVTIIRDSGQHLLELVDNLLDLTQIETDGLAMSPELVDVGEVILRVLHKSRPRAAKKRISLEHQIAKDLQPAWIDPQRLDQVLTQLIDNAVKFTGTGGRVQVRARCLEEEPRSLEIDVEDTGIGIAEEEQSLIFEVFRQLDGGLDRRHEGTGLGLALCRKLMRLLGGGIRVHSTPGRGSTFSVTVPVPAALKSPSGNRRFVPE